MSPETLARACARHPWRVVGAWGAVLAGSLVLVATLLGSALVTESDVTTRTEAKRADELIEERLPEATAPEWEYLIVPAEAAGRGAAALREAGLEPVGEVTPAPDGETALVPFVVPSGGDVAAAIPVAERLDGSLYGGEIVNHDFHEISERDLRVAETFGVAAALVVLALVFGSLVSALVPLALAGVAIVVALAGAALVGQAIDLSVFVTNMVAGMGLALGIDYSLFVLSRYREERAAGRSVEDAIGAAGATASRAVLFSGTAVAIALASMAFVPDSVLRSLASGAVLVAAASVAAALTLLPALLGLLGDRVNRLRVPWVGGTGEGEGRFWGRVARLVMRRPVVSLVAASALLLALAVPVLGLETGAAGVSTLPDRLPSKQGFLALERAFGTGSVRPAQVVVAGDVARSREAIDEVAAALRRDPVFSGVEVVAPPERDVALISANVAGDPTGPTAIEAIERLRGEYVPAAGFPEGVEVAIGGLTAANRDYVEASNASRPLIFVFVLGLSFVLLTVAFRSLVVPAKAIGLNLLSVGAAYGLLALVFDGPIEVWVPLLLFALLFGLSMDYHVFLLSRIRERYRLSGDNELSVQFGIGSTARIITGAALIIIVVFTGFMLGELVMFQQMGFGVAVALLIDATIVRVVLVPAAMKLLGERNWWLPRWLGWLPQLTVEKAAWSSGAPGIHPRSDDAAAP